ncbi:MAG: caspase family protein [Bacteroidota bacterium]
MKHTNRILFSLFILFFFSSLIPATAQDEFSILYIHRLKKTTNSDVTYKIWFNNTLMGELKKVNVAVSADAKGRWLVCKQPVKGKFYLRITQGKENSEVDRLLMYSAPGKSYYIQFDPAVGYGEKSLTAMAFERGASLFATASPEDIAFAHPEISSVVLERKDKLVDDLLVYKQAPDDTVAIEYRGAKPNNNIVPNNNYSSAGSGKNYLLVIGINDYKFWPKLNNAVKDAHDMKDILLSKYNFASNEVLELYDDAASKKNILEKLTKLKDVVTESDNVLIYFSGHGWYNKEIDEGYWIPFNAQKNEETDYLPNSTLLKYIKALTCKHVFMIADACFSGALFSQGSRGYVDNVEKFKSRWGLTSGRLEAVSDGFTGTNSPFASFVIKFLKENSKEAFPCSEMIQYVKVSVSNNAEQTPIGNPLRNVGDEGGEFIFHMKK